MRHIITGRLFMDIIYDPSLEEANNAYAIAIKVKEIIMLKIKI